jgi:hypothetical protein
MSNGILLALMSAASQGLGEASEKGKKLETAIYSSTLLVSSIAAYRVGRAIAQGATAEEKEKKWSNAFTEFQKHFIAEGNNVWRDSEELPEFKAIKTTIRKKEPVNGTQVNGYIGRCRELKLTKKEHGIAEVQSLSKKLFTDVQDNHAHILTELAALDSLAAVAKRWQEFVEANYPTTYYSLKVALSGGGTGKGQTEAEKVKKAVDLLADLTDADQLAEIVARLQRRIDEMTEASVEAIAQMTPKAIILPGQANDEDGVPESDAAYTDRVAA